MFEVFHEEKLLSTLLFAFLGLSIFLRVFLGMLYQNMINETDNMAITENRLLRQCKTKFSNCYQMGNGVSNIPVFVDKFLNRMTFGRINFSTIYHLSGQTMLLSVVTAGVGICKSIAVGRTLGDILPFYIVSFIGLYLYFSISTFVDIKGKRRVLKVNLIDYLENHLSPRIHVTDRDIQMLYGEASFEEKPTARGQLQDFGEERRNRRQESIGEERRSRRRESVGEEHRSRRREILGEECRSRRESFGEECRVEAETTQKPKENRVIELMPIGNRKAAGGENFAVGEGYVGGQNLATRNDIMPEQNNISEQAQTTVTAEELEALLKEFLAF